MTQSSKELTNNERREVNFQDVIDNAVKNGEVIIINPYRCLASLKTALLNISASNDDVVCLLRTQSDPGDLKSLPENEYEEECEVALNAYRAALNYAMDSHELESNKLLFLELWREGSFKEIQEEFPDFDITSIGPAAMKSSGITVKK